MNASVCFRKQKQLRRHYKYCKKVIKDELNNAEFSRQNIHACYDDFHGKKLKQHYSNKAFRIKIPWATPIKFRFRGIGPKPSVINFFE